MKHTLVMQHPVKGWGTHAKGLAPEVVVGGLYPELSLVQSRRNMTEWSASEPRHWAVNLMLCLNYNINLQLSHLHTSIHSNYPSWKIVLTSQLNFVNEDFISDIQRKQKKNQTYCRSLHSIKLLSQNGFETLMESIHQCKPQISKGGEIMVIDFCKTVHPKNAVLEIVMLLILRNVPFAFCCVE